MRAKKTPAKPVRASKVATERQASKYGHDTFTPYVDKLKEVFSRIRGGELEGYHEAGCVLQEFHSKHDAKGNRVGGKDAVTILAKATKLNPRTLYHCRDFAQKFSKDEVSRIVDEGGVTWSHVVCVLPYKKAKERNAWLQKVREESWPVSRLRRELNTTSGNRRSKRKRGPAVPKNVPDGVQKLLGVTTTFTRRLELSLFCKEFHLAEQAMEMSADKVAEALRDELETAIKQLKESATVARAQLSGLKKALDRFDEVLAIRNGKTVEEGEDDDDEAEDADEDRDEEDLDVDDSDAEDEASGDEDDDVEEDEEISDDEESEKQDELDDADDGGADDEDEDVDEDADEEEEVSDDDEESEEEDELDGDEEADSDEEDEDADQEEESPRAKSVSVAAQARKRVAEYRQEQKRAAEGRSSKA